MTRRLSNAWKGFKIANAFLLFPRSGRFCRGMESRRGLTKGNVRVMLAGGGAMCASVLAILPLSAPAARFATSP